MKHGIFSLSTGAGFLPSTYIYIYIPKTSLRIFEGFSHSGRLDLRNGFCCALKPTCAENRTPGTLTLRSFHAAETTPGCFTRWPTELLGGLGLVNLNIQKKCHFKRCQGQNVESKMLSQTLLPILQCIIWGVVSAWGKLWLKAISIWYLD